MYTFRTPALLVMMVSGVLLAAAAVQRPTVIHVGDDALPGGNGAKLSPSSEYLQDNPAEAVGQAAASDVGVVQVDSHAESTLAQGAGGHGDDPGDGRLPVVGAPRHDRSRDCNSNSIPDVCDLDCTALSGACNVPGCGESSDCNSNAILDECDIAGGTSVDCNANGIPDECEPAEDCNTNGIQDICDIAAGTSADCQPNGVPDECEVAGNDCNTNSIPDECEPDCNTNSVADKCDIAAGTSADCQPNGVPDECELAGNDCNSNGTPDECETILYMDDSATNGLNDGTSWPNAYTELQDALAYANSNACVVQVIQVAAGIYTPDRATGDRSATFQLLNGVELKGGYAGVGAPDPSLRDVDSNASILSGDLAGDDGPDFTNNDENSYRVVTAIDVDISTVLDGFTITAGHADLSSPDPYSGAGVYIANASPTIVNCRLTGNQAANQGAGVHISNGSPTITNCRLTGNRADNGAAMSIMWDSVPTLTGCSFEMNASSYYGAVFGDRFSGLSLLNCAFTGNPGGAVSLLEAGGEITVENCLFLGTSSGAAILNIHCYDMSVVNCTFVSNSASAISNYGGEMDITNSVFVGNSSSWAGGAISSGGGWNFWSFITLTNCLLAGNTSDSWGGALFTGDFATVTNCTLVGNVADVGGGLYNYYDELSGYYGDATVSNCIFWDNRDNTGTSQQGQIYKTPGSTLAVNYTCLQGWTGSFGGTYNFGHDPRLVDMDGPDNTVGTLDDDLRLTAGSLCLDSGNNQADTNTWATGLQALPAIDLRGLPRFVNDPIAPNTGVGPPPIVDRGAYEYQADCNTNGVIDSVDLHTGTSEDCNGNGIPDECITLESDCNTNAVPDECDIAEGTSADCQPNGTPDECDACSCGDGDADENGVIDLDDYAVFRLCLTGPEVPLAVGCEALDMDGDCAIDLRDLAGFQQAFSAP